MFMYFQVFRTELIQRVRISTREFFKQWARPPREAIRQAVLCESSQPRLCAPQRGAEHHSAACAVVKKPQKPLVRGDFLKCVWLTCFAFCKVIWKLNGGDGIAMNYPGMKVSVELNVGSNQIEVNIDSNPSAWWNRRVNTVSGYLHWWWLKMSHFQRQHLSLLISGK